MITPNHSPLLFKHFGGATIHANNKTDGPILRFETHELAKKYAEMFCHSANNYDKLFEACEFMLKHLDNVYGEYNVGDQDVIKYLKSVIILAKPEGES